MKSTEKKSLMHRTLNVMTVLALAGWTATSVMLVSHEFHDARSQIELIAHATAVESIKKDVLYRHWVADLGGVYAPVSAKTPPNPYLSSVPERDIVTPSGRKLTLINPAYMSHQIAEIGRRFNDIQGHITSLKPLSPENAPDPWEARALTSVEKGAAEFGEVTAYRGASYYRLLQPLFMEAPCLKCHAAQGYKLGDLRGGISSSVPMSIFARAEHERFTSDMEHFGTIWLLGTAGIVLAVPYVRRRINEREAAVDEARDRERRLRAVVDNAPFGAHVYRMEEDGRLLFNGGNAEAERILGSEERTLLGRTFEEIFPSAAAGQVPAMMRVVVSEGIPQVGELVDILIEGEERTLEIHAVQTGQGQVSMFFRDVTERWRAERSLRESEERYRTIVNTSREGIVTLDADGNVSFVNSRLAALLGYRQEEVIGKPGGSFIPGEEQDDHAQQMLLRKKGIATQYERRLVRKDGSAVWTIISASPLTDDQDRFIGSFAMLTDITERVEMEQALASSESQLRAIFDTMQAGVILVDEGGSITFANRRMAEMVDCALDALIGSSYTDLVHPDERGVGDDRMRKLIEGKIDHVITERHYLRRDGTSFWGYVSARRLEETSGGPVTLLGIIQDITGLKRLESELRLQSEIAGNIAEGVYLVSVSDLTILYANPRMEQLFGYGKGEMNGKHVSVINAPTGGDPVETATEIETALNTSGAWRGDVLNIRKDGTTFWGHASISMSHHPVYGDVYVSLQMDISDSKNAEAALRESEARLKEAQHLARMGSWDYDLKSGVLQWSEETYRIFGLDPAQTATREYVVSCIHPEDRELYKRSIREAERNGKKPWSCEYRIVRDNGDIRYVREEAQTQLGAGGAAMRWKGIVQDITDRKRSEAALQRSEALSRTIIESEPECVKILGPGGILQFMNPAGLAMIEADSLSAVTGRCVYPLILPEHRQAFEALADRVLNGESGRLEFEMEGFRGTRRWLETHAVPLRDGAGRVEALLGITRDVTDRKAAELHRKQLEEQLLQSQKIESLGRLAGGIAHDINNMLMPVMGYADLLSQGIPSHDPRAADVQGIIHSTDRIKSITTQLLAFARKQTLDIRPLDLNTVVRGFEKMLRRTIRENITIETRFALSPCMIQGDAGQIEQIMLNLAINAQDAMPGGGLLVVETSPVMLGQEFVEQHRGSVQGPHVLLQVKDSGIGMSPDILQKIFEPFYSTKARGRGTGLGLPMVYGIVKQHGGYIDVESKPGEGSSFRIYFPATNRTETGEEVNAVKAVVTGTETILVGEAQKEVLVITRSLLSACGYNVLTAGSGEEALAIANQHRDAIALLITDVVMPGMNGRELYVKMSAVVPGLRVLYMSGYSDDIISTQGVLHTGTNFLPKPFSVAALSKKVRQVIDL